MVAAVALSLMSKEAGMEKTCDISFPFERALLLMREGKKVQQVGYSEAYCIKDGQFWCASHEHAIVAFGANEIVKSRWLLVD